MIDSSNYTGTMSNIPCASCGRRNCTMSIAYGSHCPFFVYHKYSSYAIATGYCDYRTIQKAKKKKGKKTYYRGYCAQVIKPYIERQINNNNKQIKQYKGWLTNITIQRRNITRD